jgi:hypothetical protein
LRYTVKNVYGFFVQYQMVIFQQGHFPLFRILYRYTVHMMYFVCLKLRNLLCVAETLRVFLTVNVKRTNKFLSPLSYRGSHHPCFVLSNSAVEIFMTPSGGWNRLLFLPLLSNNSLSENKIPKIYISVLFYLW